MVNPDNPNFWDTDRWELANRRLQGAIDDLEKENSELKRQVEQLKKDWSADAINKTEVIVGLEKKVEAYGKLVEIADYLFQTDGSYLSTQVFKKAQIEELKEIDG